MPTVRLELQLPSKFWLARLGRAFPRHTLWVLAMQGLRSGNGIVDLAVHDLPTSASLALLRRDPDVVDARLLELRRQDALLHVEYRRLVLVPIFGAAGLLPRFPFAVRGGSAFWEVLGVGERTPRLVRLIEERMPGSRVREVFPTRAHSTASTLTARQADVFQRAVERGYYASPRRTNLSRLARELGVSKGSLSVMLVKIEARLAEHWTTTSTLPRLWDPGEAR